MFAGTSEVEEEQEKTKLRSFSLSAIDKAKNWFLDHTTHTMTNWNVLEEKFPNCSVSNNKFMDAKTTIAVFSPGAREALSEV